MIQHQFVLVRHTGRQQAYFGSTTSKYVMLVRPVGSIHNITAALIPGRLYLVFIVDKHNIDIVNIRYLVFTYL